MILHDITQYSILCSNTVIPRLTSDPANFSANEDIFLLFFGLG